VRRVDGCLPNDRRPVNRRWLYLLNGGARFHEVSWESGSNHARNSLESLRRRCHIVRDFSVPRTVRLAGSPTANLLRVEGVRPGGAFGLMIAKPSPFNRPQKPDYWFVSLNSIPAESTLRRSGESPHR
jgi:hypothetical protein